MTKKELKEKCNAKVFNAVLHRATNLHNMFNTPMGDAIRIMYNTYTRPSKY